IVASGTPPRVFMEARQSGWRTGVAALASATVWPRGGALHIHVGIYRVAERLRALYDVPLWLGSTCGRPHAGVVRCRHCRSARVPCETRRRQMGRTADTAGRFALCCYRLFHLRSGADHILLLAWCAGSRALGTLWSCVASIDDAPCRVR